MNFNIYIHDQLYKELETYRQSLGKTRNSLVKEALTEWLQKHRERKVWPEGLFKFDKSVIGKFPDVKELRKNLNEPDEHLL